MRKIKRNEKRKSEIQRQRKTKRNVKNLENTKLFCFFHFVSFFFLEN